MAGMRQVKWSVAIALALIGCGEIDGDLPGAGADENVVRSRSALSTTANQSLLSRRPR